MTSLMLFVLAETPVHAGTGAALSVIDLPIARERLTQFPVIPGSGLKGALREHLRGNADLATFFGPDTAHASDHAGSLSFAEARVLLYPVRSLQALYVYAICPTVAYRFSKDARDTAAEADAAALWDAIEPHLGQLTDGNALCAGNAAVLQPAGAGPGRIVLEEVSFEAIQVPALQTAAAQLAGKWAGDALVKRAIEARLVVLTDDVFRHFVTTTTEVNTHVALVWETKTVKTGALFSVEDLPSETLLYSRVSATNERRPAGANRQADQVANAWKQAIGLAAGQTARLQVGGDETTGKGRVSLRLA